MRAITHLGIAGFVLAVGIAVVSRTYRLQAVIVAFGVLGAAYCAEFLWSSFRRRKGAPGSSSTARVVVGEVQLRSGRLCLSDNWKGTSQVTMQCPTGDYEVALETEERRGDVTIASMTLSAVGPCSSAGPFSVAVSVDSGFLVFVDAEFLEKAWDKDMMKERVLSMLEASSNSPGYFLIHEGTRSVGLVLVPGEGDGVYTVRAGIGAGGGFAISCVFD